MYQDITALAFYLQLRHLLEDEDATAFNAQQIGRAVALATEEVRKAAAPFNTIPNLQQVLTGAPDELADEAATILGLSSGAEFIDLPGDFSKLIMMTAGDIPVTFLDSYDPWLFSQASKSRPVACRMNKYILTAPTTINSITINYQRFPYRCYKEGSANFASTTTMALTGQIVEQWLSGLLWEDETAFVDGSYHPITGSSASLITFTTALAGTGTNNYRLFQLPDISKDLLAAVLYKAAMILDGGDPTGGTWMQSYQDSVGAFLKTGGDK
jgi:hypothetical protein